MNLFTSPLFWSVLLLAAIGIIAGYSESPEDVRNVLENRFGEVPWSHEFHARNADISCTTCHHKSTPKDANPQPCSECHTHPGPSDHVFASAPHRMEAAAMAKVMPQAEAVKEGEKAEGKPEAKPAKSIAPSRRQAFHKSCQGCHKAMNRGPVQCRECHRSVLPAEAGSTGTNHARYAAERKIACETCHIENQPAKAVWGDCQKCHDKDYQHILADGDKPYDHTAFFRGMSGEVSWDHREHIRSHMDFGGKTRDCLNCHHLDKAFPKQNYRNCRGCHQEKSWTTEQGKTVPNAEKAMHKVCFECHDITRSDLPKGMPVTCNECHAERKSHMGSSFGPVIWPHEGHAVAEGVDCAKCHHKDEAGQPKRACATCHQDKEVRGALALKDAMHMTCIGCHDVEKKGPTGCRGCHAYPEARSKVWHANQMLAAKNAEMQLSYQMLSNPDALANMAKPAPLPSLNELSAKSEEIHRVHVDAGGFPCLDCHHNLKPTQHAQELFKTLPPRQPRNCNLMASPDGCQPDWTDPQTCASCHDNPAMKIVDSKEAERKLCADCHTELAPEIPFMKSQEPPKVDVAPKKEEDKAKK